MRGRLACMSACLHGDLEELRAAVARADNVNSQNADGETALMCAVATSDIEDQDSKVRLLLEQPSIDVNMSDKRGETALMYAAQEGNLEAVKVFLEDGRADVNIQNQKGQTALTKTAHRLSQTDRGEFLKILKLLLEQPSLDVNLADDNGFTALHAVAFLGHIEAVKLLLADDRTDVNYKDKHKKTPLIITAAAVKPENITVLGLLLAEEAIEVNWGANIGGYENVTALQVAVYQGNTQAVKLLLADPRVDINCKDSLQRTSLNNLFVAEKWSNSSNKVNILKLLLAEERVDVNWAAPDQKGQSMTPLVSATHFACKDLSPIEAVQILLDDPRVDVNWTRSTGVSALHVAAANAGEKGLEVLKLFLAHERVDINCKRDSNGPTVLHVAAVNNNVEAVKIILSDPRLTSANTNNPFLILSNQRFTLAKATADNFTALTLAAANRKREALKELLHNPSIDIDGKNEDGLTLDDELRWDYLLRRMLTLTLIQLVYCMSFTSDDILLPGHCQMQCKGRRS